MNQKKRLEIRMEIYRLRNQGMTFPQIENKTGISKEYAAKLFRDANSQIKQPTWCGNLSKRAVNGLRKLGISSREEALAALNSGKLKPSRGVRQYGQKSHEEVLEWLGIRAQEQMNLAKIIARGNAARKLAPPETDGHFWLLVEKYEAEFLNHTSINPGDFHSSEPGSS